MKTKLLILLLVLLSNLSFAQKVLNMDYKFQDKELKVAIVPLTNEMTKFNDSISNDIFKDTLSLKFLNVEKLRAELNDKTTEIPIGVSCRTCDRLDCSQRAFPPLHKKFDVDINTRGVSIYVNDND